MSNIDITPESVGALVKEAMSRAKYSDCWCPNSRAAATLRALSERIAELEAENAILRTEKHADAEAIGAARTDALREAADWHLEVARYNAGGMEYSALVGIPISNWKELDISVKTHEWCAREILALIEGDTNG